MPTHFVPSSERREPFAPSGRTTPPAGADRPWLRLLVLTAALFIGLPSSGAAQVTRADSAAVLLHAARTLQDEGRTGAAQALLQYITERFGDTRAGGEALAALRLLPRESTNQSAQVELMVWATTYGAWLGVATAGAFDANDPAPYGAGLLLGGPGGFLAGRALARSRSLSEGQVRAITFGSLWGTWQGYGLMEVLDWGEKKVCPPEWGGCYREDPDGKDVFRALVLGGLAGTVTGGILARKPISSGVATTVNFGALWGTWFGLAGGVLADLEGDPLLTSTLIGGNVGLLATASLAPTWDLSRDRARLISIAGVIGGLAGAGLDLMIQPDDEKVAFGIPLAGSLVGLAAGAALTTGMDRRGPAGSRGGASDGGFAGLGGSLLRLQNGGFSLGLPAPFPTMVPVESARGLSYRPAAGFTLLKGSF